MDANKNQIQDGELVAPKLTAAASKTEVDDKPVTHAALVETNGTIRVKASLRAQVPHPGKC